MIHINLTCNEGTSVPTAEPEAGKPVIKPLSACKPGDTLSPSSPWHGELGWQPEIPPYFACEDTSRKPIALAHEGGNQAASFGWTVAPR